MTAPNFEAVARLSAQEQRRLLDGGDSPERLWAAWALALQIGRDALPLLSSVEEGEISEGLRRQLLVVLAGLGERRLLETILSLAANSDAARDARWRCLSAIQSSLTAETVGFLSGADRDMVRALFEKTLDDYRGELEAYGPDSDEGFSNAYQEELERLVQLLR